jgi:hypothetical protein
LEQFEDVKLYIILDKYDFADRTGKSMAEDHLQEMIDAQFGRGQELKAMIVPMIFSNSVLGSLLREFAVLAVADCLGDHPLRANDFPAHLERFPDFGFGVVETLAKNLFDEIH